MRKHVGTRLRDYQAIEEGDAPQYVHLGMTADGLHVVREKGSKRREVYRPNKEKRGKATAICFQNTALTYARPYNKHTDKPKG